MLSCRLCVVTFDWYPSEPRVYRLSDTAAAMGCEVDVICVHRSDQARYEVCNNVHVYRLPVRRHYAGSMPDMLRSWFQFLLLATIQVTRLHRQHPYDVLHIHNIPDFLVFSALFPRLTGAKIILDVQDVTPELLSIKVKGEKKRALLKRLAIWQERLSTSFVDHIVTVGWPFEELLLQRGVPSEKLTIILNSAYPPLFPFERRPPLPVERPIEEERPFILMYHGTVVERYGLDIAIRAVALAARQVPNLLLKITGPGSLSYMSSLKQLTDELGIREHVVFGEPISLDMLTDFIVHGDVGIIPYRDDPFTDLLMPTKAYEFAWLQRPMIASGTRAMRSMFRPESVAFCDPSQPESFAEAIVDLYQHPEKRASMIVHASEDYEPYRWEAMAERYEQLLATLSKRIY
jgi:glycosyltransferase involved in cell wall biosynthesis